MKFLATLFCIVLALIGLALIGGGAWLLRLGGSPYYAIIGLAYLVAALLLWRRKTAGGLIVLLVAVFTLPWALWESGLNFWALFARLMSPIALAGFALLFAPSLSPAANRKLFYGGALVTALIFVAGFGLSFVPHGIIRPSADITAYKTAKGDNSPSDWPSYGRTTQEIVIPHSIRSTAAMFPSSISPGHIAPEKAMAPIRTRLCRSAIRSTLARRQM